MSKSMHVLDRPRGDSITNSFNFANPHGISPVKAANVPSYSYIFSILARSQGLEKKMEKLITLFDDYKIHLQNNEQDVLKKDNIHSQLGATISYLQERQEKLKGENKSWTLVNT